jgi:hypothetical protein
MKPGVVTCRLQEHDGEQDAGHQWGGGQVNQTLRGSWSDKSRTQLLYSTLVEEGLVHHGSLIHGDYSRPCEVCDYLGIETVEVCTSVNRGGMMFKFGVDSLFGPRNSKKGPDSYRKGEVARL